ncbi:hypothetical protein SG34_003855 [Thalassomonas viridans]|uniref:FAD-binding domain-containing protein n=1 Tax=Thalassomonas viridans TaxID=137584 RepID=A0AAF0C9R6_9GAMM|nr:hypothetical protein [Thalassomonas viridans]WDE06073.1 hypothetical protein SG34_003855 [Thalassomonas viridans]
MKIAIIGASVNGLTCALLLKQCGIKVEVFESGQSLAQTDEMALGALIWPQGVDVLRFVLSREQLLGAGHPVASMDIHNAGGEPFYQVPVSQEECGDDAGEAFVFDRQRLLQILSESLGTGRIRYGMACEKITTVNNRSLVHFGDGCVQAFDLVINADNLHTLTDLFSANDTPTDTGMAVISGMTHFDHAMLSEQNSQMFLCENARLITYCVDRQSNKRYWSVIYQHNGQALWHKGDVVGQLAGVPAPLLEMINSTREGDTRQRVIRSLSNGKAWYRELNLSLGRQLKGELNQLGYGITVALENAFMLTRYLIDCNRQQLPGMLRRYQNKASFNAKVMLAMMDEMTDIFYQGDEYNIYREFKFQGGVSRYHTRQMKNTA